MFFDCFTAQLCVVIDVSSSPTLIAVGECTGWSCCWCHGWKAWWGCIPWSWTGDEETISYIYLIHEKHCLVSSIYKFLPACAFQIVPVKILILFSHRQNLELHPLGIWSYRTFGWRVILMMHLIAVLFSFSWTQHSFCSFELFVEKRISLHLFFFLSGINSYICFGVELLDHLIWLFFFPEYICVSVQVSLTKLTMNESIAKTNENRAINHYDLLVL